MLGAEIHVALTPPGAPAPPPSPAYAFLKIATRMPASIPFTGRDAGQTAHYACRWVSTRGEPGPWGAAASATVGG